MTVTRANVETVLMQRLSGLFTAAGMPVTFAGANAALNDPIGYALRRLEYTVAAPALVTDADLTALSAEDVNPLFDLAELRGLENWLGQYTAVDLQLGPRSEKFAQLIPQVRQRAEFLRKWIATEYGLEGVSIDTGAIELDFAEHFDVGDSE